VTTELAAAQMGTQEGMPMGMPTHIGTPGGPQGAPGSVAPSMAQMSAQAQGAQPGPLSAGGGPQAANIVSNTPGPGAKLSPGPA